MVVPGAGAVPHERATTSWISPASNVAYRGTSLIRKRTPLGPYSRPTPRVLGGSLGGGRFIMGEVPLSIQIPTKAPVKECVAFFGRVCPFDPTVYALNPHPSSLNPRLTTLNPEP